MNLEETLSRLLNLGLTTEPQEMVLFTDEPKFAAYVSVPSPKISSLFDTSEIFGQGMSMDPLYAKVKSIGECVERICNFYPKDETFEKMRFGTDDRMINPLSF